MEKGRKEAQIGLNGEKEIVENINTNEKIRKRLQNCLVSFIPDIGTIQSASRDNVKTDIFIYTDRSRVRASITYFKKLSDSLLFFGGEKKKWKKK